MPDKLHNLSNREAFDRTVCHGRCFVRNRNRLKHDDANRSSDDGNSMLFRNAGQPKLRSKIHQQRYAAKAHPTEGEAAKESAAMLNFECDAAACSLGHGGQKIKNSEPDQYSECTPCLRRDQRQMLEDAGRLILFSLFCMAHWRAEN